MTGESRPDPPHVEDVVVDSWSVDRRSSYSEFLRALEAAAVPLETCFGTTHQIVPGRHVVVEPGGGMSSLAVVRIPSADLYQRGGRLRLGVEHGLLGDVDLSVSDLRFMPWTKQREQMPRLSQVLATGALLTVGLTRTWGQEQQWCWLQVNGIFVEEPTLTGW